MPETQVQWYGDDLLKQIREGTPDALFEAAETFVEMAASRAPRDSGLLADSGYAATAEKSTYKANKRYNRQAKPPKNGAVAGFAAFYARFIEFGTKKKAARPFMRPTLDEAKEQLAGIVITRLKKKMKK